MPTFAELQSRWSWRPIPNCPGRFLFSAGPTRLAPAEIISPGVCVTEHIVAAAKDPVVIAVFVDGGLISYRKHDGTYLHTLNTREGFERKLQQLGLEIRT